MNNVFLLLGSNEGDRHGWLSNAAEALESSCGTITRRSSVYETAAWGIEEQPDFLNLVLEIETVLSPTELLHCIRQIEVAAGRQREIKWGQRTLDIDILFYNDDIIHTPDLYIPHPHLQERRFTLEPLNEIAPDLRHPVLKRTVADLLKECEDSLGARRVGE